jgi:hypothetical protein
MQHDVRACSMIYGHTLTHAFACSLFLHTLHAHLHACSLLGLLYVQLIILPDASPIYTYACMHMRSSSLDEFKEDMLMVMANYWGASTAFSTTTMGGIQRGAQIVLAL